MGKHPKVDRRSFDNPRLLAYYTEFSGLHVAGLAIQPHLAYEDQEALEIESKCYQIRGPRARRKFCYDPRSLEEMDRERIRALRRCIEDERPDWVEQVKWALQIDDNDTYAIIRYSGVPPYPAVAILENMKERGELPND